MADDILAKLRAGIEQRVREQLDRHLAIEPNADPRRIIDIQIEQEREQLVRVAKEWDEQGNSKGAEIAEQLAKEWLLDLAKQLKGR
jgi:hypothetical protein